MKQLSLVAAAAALILGGQAWAQPPSTADQETGCPKDIGAGVHGMVLFGTEQLYASHIPMFHSPNARKGEMFHCWRALFEIDISHPTQDAKATYRETAIENGKQRLMTLKPEPFNLPQLLDGKTSSFMATMHEKNFEQKPEGDFGLLTGVAIKVTTATHEMLSRQTSGLEHLTYLYIGPKGRDSGKSPAYLIHKISAPNNFDHIVQIEWLTADALFGAESQGDQKVKFKEVQFDDQQHETIADIVQNRLRPGQRFVATFGSSPGTEFQATQFEGQSTTHPGFVVVSDFYCLVGPGFGPRNPCP